MVVDANFLELVYAIYNAGHRSHQHFSVVQRRVEIHTQSCPIHRLLAMPSSKTSCHTQIADSLVWRVCYGKPLLIFAGRVRYSEKCPFHTAEHSPVTCSEMKDHQYPNLQLPHSYPNLWTKVNSLRNK